jgi:hypothetical protein
MAIEAADLADACLSHLGREEEALRSALETLQSVRAAALAGDVPGLESLHGRQNEAALLTQTLRTEREALRERIAALLRIPVGSASLENLAAHLGGSAGDRLRQAAARVRKLATRVEQITLSNATVLEYCLGFTRRVLRSLTGGGTPAENYGPDGTVMESPCGPFLSARG